MELSRLYFQTTTWFGAGALARLPRTCAECGIGRPLVVADRGLAEAGLLDRLLDALEAEPAAVFLDTPANPTGPACEAAAALHRESGADGVVALGGGSPIDLAKAAALLGTHAGALEDYDVMRPGGGAEIGAHAAPLIAVPTTAGTGSEVGRAAVISVAGDRKLVLASPRLFPRATLADPELTLGLPPALTAGSGMDAITHCIEGFLSPNRNPPARAVALDGLARLLGAVERATARGDDLAARGEMMMGSLEGGMAMANGLGAVHAMSHAAGGLHALGLHHGTLNAVLLPTVLRFNMPAAEADIARLAEVFGLPSAAALPEGIAALNARLGLPPSLAAMGVPAEGIEALAERAAADFTSPTNIRPATREDYRALFIEALDAGG